MDNMLTRQEAARRLGLSAQTVSRMVREGVLPAYRVGTRKVFVPTEALEKYLASRRINTVKEN